MVNNIDAQESKQEKTINLEKERKHFVHAEIVGRSFLFGSLNYEYAIAQKFSLGAGLGLAYIGTGEIIRNNIGSTETGRYIETNSTQMIYANYFIGKNKHKLFFTAGLTNFLSTDKQKYPTEILSSSESMVEWNAGIGYQLSLARTYFRFTGYCIRIPGDSIYFPKYLPWLGIAVGVKI